MRVGDQGLSAAPQRGIARRARLSGTAAHHFRSSSRRRCFRRCKSHYVTRRDRRRFREFLGQLFVEPALENFFALLTEYGDDHYLIGARNREAGILNDEMALGMGVVNLIAVTLRNVNSFYDRAVNGVEQCSYFGIAPSLKRVNSY